MRKRSKIEIQIRQEQMASAAKTVQMHREQPGIIPEKQQSQPRPPNAPPPQE